MARLAYFRVSTADQSIESQRLALGGQFDKEYSDIGVSGAIQARSRPGLSALLTFAREGDTIYIYALDRFGRDAIDVQQTVRELLKGGIHIHIHGLGLVGTGVGELVVAVLAQISQIERQRIIERCAAGREAAKESMRSTGRTHRGKLSLGRPPAADGEAVRSWRQNHSATISQTAAHFSISSSSVSRYCR